MQLLIFYAILSIAPAVLTILTVRQLQRRAAEGKAAQLSIFDLFFLPIHFLPMTLLATKVNAAWSSLQYPTIALSLVLFGGVFQSSLAAFAWCKGGSFTWKHNFIALFVGALGGAYFGVVIFWIAYSLSMLGEKVDLDKDIARIIQ